ncbi:hypothetical protein HK096_003063 [Nowakowskiella sp. JEL0078]|nr:hypothetical protein HK096_003063 [Nowakowskiella sp. JEL0078]
MAIRLFVVYFLAFFAAIAFAEEENEVRRRHNYKMSFKKPYYWLNDNKTIPYFETSPNVLLSQNFIRLTMSLPNQQGAIWTQHPNEFKEWQIEFSVLVSGRGSIGSEGFAFWYKKEKFHNGPLYGSDDNWHGLGVLFDTASPEENRLFPYTFAVENDGTKDIKYRKDHPNFSLGGCYRDYRNTPGPVWYRITYSAGKLTVEADLRQNGKAYSSCLSAILEKELPTGYYFGVTASTGNPHADDHDILEFKMYELNPSYKPKKEQLKDHVFTENEKKLIHDIQNTVDDLIVEEDEEPETLNPHAVTQLMENQLKIIEDLNIIITRIGESSSPLTHKGQYADSRKLEDLSRQFGLLITEVQNLASAVRDMGQNGQQNNNNEAVQRIEDHLNSLHAKVDSTRQAANDAAGFSSKVLHEKRPSVTSHNWVLYLLAVIGGAGLMYSITIVRRITKREKKFI